MLNKLTLEGAYNLYNYLDLIVQVKNGKVIIIPKEA